MSKLQLVTHQRSVAQLPFGVAARHVQPSPTHCLTHGLHLPHCAADSVLMSYFCSRPEYERTNKNCAGVCVCVCVVYTTSGCECTSCVDSPTVRRTLLLSGEGSADTEARQSTRELFAAVTRRLLVTVRRLLPDSSALTLYSPWLTSTDRQL